MGSRSLKPGGIALTAIFLVACVSVLGAPGSSSSGQGVPKKLGDAFNVWGVRSDTDPLGKMNRDPTEDPTGQNFLDPRSKSSCAPFYDHNASLNSGSRRMLNHQWDLVIQLNHAALTALSPHGYETQLHNRNHAKAFFGIEPQWDEDRKRNTIPTTTERDRDIYTNGSIYRHVMQWYQYVQNYITRDRAMFAAKYPKPILACGSQFMLLQQPHDLLRTSDGSFKIDERTGERITLLQNYGQNFLDTHDVTLIGPPFWFYNTSPKSGQAWPIDREFDRSHYCMNEENHGLSQKVELGYQSNEEVTIIIMCPDQLRLTNHVLARPALTRQTVGTKLDSLETVAGTFYHEMFHLFEADHIRGRATFDYPVMIASQLQGWPTSPASWAPHPHDLAANTGIEALYQTLHTTLAQWSPPPPPQQHPPISRTSSLVSPNTYAWFALVSLMSSRTGQDWSGGVPRDPGVWWTPVYAKGSDAPGHAISEAQLRHFSSRVAEEYTKRMRAPDGNFGGGPSRAQIL